MAEKVYAKRLKEIMAERKKNGKKNPVPDCNTVTEAKRSRRNTDLCVNLGWKHWSNSNYEVVPKTSRIVEVARNSSLSEVEQICCDALFTGGSREGLKLKDCEYFLAKCNGAKLPAMINGEPFRFEDYRKGLPSPLRLYIFTKKVRNLDQAAVVPKHGKSKTDKGKGKVDNDEAENSTKQNCMKNLHVSYISIKKSIYSDNVTTISIRNMEEVQQYVSARQPDLGDIALDHFNPLAFDFFIQRIYCDSSLIVEGIPNNDKITYTVTSQGHGQGMPLVLCGSELSDSGNVPVLVCILEMEAEVEWTLNEAIVNSSVSSVSLIRPRMHGIGEYRCLVESEVIATILVDNKFNMTPVELSKKKDLVKSCSSSEDTDHADSGVSAGEDFTCVNVGAPCNTSDVQHDKKTWSLVPPEDIEIGQLLKEGGMSTVFRARYLGTTVAAKKILTAGRRKGRTHAIVEKELSVHSCLHCESIAQLVGYSQFSPQYGYILVEHIDGPDMDEFIFDESFEEKYLKLTEQQKNLIALDMVSSIVYLHGQRPPIIHQDVKPGNYVLRLSDLRVKLIDLGLGKVRQLRTIGRTNHVDAVEGTLSYMPPEKLLTSKDGNAPGDVWSLGACLCEVYTREEIWTVPDKEQDEMKFLCGLMKKRSLPNALASLKSQKHCHYQMLSSALEYQEDKRCCAKDLAIYFSQQK